MMIVGKSSSDDGVACLVSPSKDGGDGLVSHFCPKYFLAYFQ